MEFDDIFGIRMSEYEQYLEITLKTYPDLTIDGFGVWTDDNRITYSGQKFDEKRAELVNFDRIRLIDWWIATNEAGPNMWEGQRTFRSVARLIAPRKFNFNEQVPVGVLVVFADWLSMEIRKSQWHVVPDVRLREGYWYRGVPDTTWYSYKYMGRPLER